MACILPLVAFSFLLAQALAMKMQIDNATMKIVDCSTIMGAAQAGQQDQLVQSGAHMRAISAMKEHPENPDLQVQCGNALAALVQWKGYLAEKVGAAGGEVGPIELMTIALKNFPDNLAVRGQMSNLGSFCDFIAANRKRVNKAGAIELVHQIIHDHYDALTETFYQCFASTQCPLPTENALKFLQMGYIEHSVKAMEDFPDVGSRGEAIFVLNMCWSGDDSYLRRMVDANMIPGIISAIHDAPNKRIDVLDTPTRVFKSGMELMSKFSNLGADIRQKMVIAGAIEAIDFALTVQGNEKTHMAFGGAYGIVGTACKALASVTSDGDPLLKNKSLSVTQKLKHLVAQNPLSLDNLDCLSLMAKSA